jgi:hypothetical protein
VTEAVGRQQQELVLMRAEEKVFASEAFLGRT